MQRLRNSSYIIPHPAGKNKKRRCKLSVKVKEDQIDRIVQKKYDGFIRNRMRGVDNMDQNALERREKLLKLQEELLAVEQDRLAGRSGCTLEELEAHLDRIIAET